MTLSSLQPKTVPQSQNPTQPNDPNRLQTYHVLSTCQPPQLYLVVTESKKPLASRLGTMVSFRFPFSFSQPPPATWSSATSRPFSAITAAVTVAAAFAGVAAVSQTNPTNQTHPFLQNALNFFFANRSLPLWGSLSLNDTPASVVDSKTGVAFPSVLAESRRLLGIGLRRKRVLGLKNIDVYAYGIAFLFFPL